MNYEKNSTESLLINYSDEPVHLNDKSIFLAGPTPRKNGVQSWRPEAIEILKEIGFKGVVYVPERKKPQADYDYNMQVEWEWKALDQAGIIAFWVPRKLPDMPGFTTNVEFGLYIGARVPTRILYGRPDWAEKKGYLDKLYKHMTGSNPITTLHDLMTQAYWRL